MQAVFGTTGFRFLPLPGRLMGKSRAVLLSDGTWRLNFSLKLRLQDADMEGENVIGVGKRYHAIHTNLFNVIRRDDASNPAALSFRIAVKATTDTMWLDA